MRPNTQTFQVPHHTPSHIQNGQPMNRRERREHERKRRRFVRAVDAMFDAAHADGKP
jgi:hypothetical protein